MNDRRAAALLIAIATLFFADVLFLGYNFWFRDLFVYHFPMKMIVRDTIARGEFPWWNPFFGGGQPMAANPAYELFYLPQWLIFLGPYRFGFALHIVAHVYIALLGGYAFLRAISLRIHAAMFGALSFGFSGFLLGTMTNLPTFFVWSWAGVVGWAILRLARGGRIAPAALALAMPLLVLEPVSLIQLFALVIAGVAVFARHALRRVIAAMLLAAAISAVVIVPAIDHARDSIRSRGFSYTEASANSMPPIRPLELVMPRVLGVFDGDLRAFWGYFYDGKRVAPYLLSLYCGAGVAILAIAGLILRRRGAIPVAAICAVSYLLAIGGNTPLFRWLYACGIHSIRYPEKFIGAALVTLIVFAATVANELDDPKVRRTLAITGCVIAVALVVTVVLVNTNMFLRMWDLQPQHAALAGMFRRRTAVAALIAAAWALTLGRGWRTVTVALVLLDLGVFSEKLLPRMPRSFFTPPPITAALDHDRSGYAIFLRGEWTQQDIAVRNEGASLAWFARNALRPYSPAAWGFRTALEADIDETYLLPTHDLYDRMKALGSTDPFIAMSNVRYVFDFRPPSEAMAESKNGPATWQPLVMHRVANGGRYSIDRGRVIAVRETSSTADLDVEGSGPSQLLITITRHKYWRASVDGQKAALQPANIAYQALAIPAGRHHVALRYQNPVVLWSGAISALALLILSVAQALLPARRTDKSVGATSLL
jgi:hypothetical protein